MYSSFEEGDASHCAHFGANGLVLDRNLRQIMVGDFVYLTAFNSVVDRAVVVSVNGTLVEFVVLLTDNGMPETIVLDLRNPDKNTGWFGKYGYIHVTVIARKNEPGARDFARQLIASCSELERTRLEFPRCNPFLAAQAKMRLEFLKSLLNV